MANKKTESDIEVLRRLLKEDRDNSRKIEEARYEPKPKPMPTIQSNPNVRGPIYFTEKWVNKKTRKKLKRNAKNQHDARFEITKLIALREHLIHKLNTLDFGKKKDYKQIAAINNKLNEIDAEIEMLETQSGVHVEDLRRGNRLGSIWNKVKTTGKKVVKSVKRFFKRNGDIIFGVLSVVIPSIISLFSAKLQKSES